MEKTARILVEVEFDEDEITAEQVTADIDKQLGGTFGPSVKLIDVVD